MSTESAAFADILNNCLGAIERGEATVEDCLRQYPEYQAQLSPLLAMAGRLSDLHTVQPSPAFRSQASVRLQARLTSSSRSPKTGGGEGEAQTEKEQCVTGDTLLALEGGRTVPIVDIRAGDYVLSLNEATGKVESRRVKGLLDMGVKPVYKLTTSSGRSVKTTATHPYRTRAGWVKVSKLEEGQEIAVPR